MTTKELRVSAPCWALCQTLLLLLPLLLWTVPTGAVPHRKLLQEQEPGDEDWLRKSSPVLIKWVLVFTISPMGLLSLILIVLSALELHGMVPPPACARSYCGASIIGLVWWPLVLIISIYEVVKGQTVVVVFLVWSVFAICAHATLLAIYLRRQRMAGGIDNPKKELLVHRDKAHRQSDKEDDTAAQQDIPTFRAPIYGLLPGTSTGAYQIFLPEDNFSPTSGGAHPNSDQRGSRSPTDSARLPGAGPATAH